MELFGINNGRLVFATGAALTEQQIRNINAAAANTLLDIKVEKKIVPPQVTKEILTYEQRFDAFKWKVQQYKDANPGKYPISFYTNFIRYWTEDNEKKKKMRFEDEKFFDVGRRLATSWQSRTDQQKNEYWKQDKAL